MAQAVPQPSKLTSTITQERLPHLENANKVEWPMAADEF
jgi:hypothetical protein